jgi:hypothetical protein
VHRHFCSWTLEMIIQMTRLHFKRAYFLPKLSFGGYVILFVHFQRYEYAFVVQNRLSGTTLPRCNIGWMENHLSRRDYSLRSRNHLRRKFGGWLQTATHSSILLYHSLLLWICFLEVQEVEIFM